MNSFPKEVTKRDDDLTLMREKKPLCKTERDTNKTIINFLKLKDYEKELLVFCSSSHGARSMQQ